MSNYFLDYSAASNGDGSVATPFNTHVGMGEVAGDKVWIRRNTTFALTAAWILVTGVSYYGYPESGDPGYMGRPANATWDSDPSTRTELTIVNTHYVGIASADIGWYNLDISKTGSDKMMYVYSVAKNFTLDNAKFTQTYAAGHRALYMTGSAINNVAIRNLVIEVEQLNSSYNAAVIYVKLRYSSIQAKVIIKNTRSSSHYLSTVINMETMWFCSIRLKIELGDTNQQSFQFRVYNCTECRLEVDSITDSHPGNSVGIDDAYGLSYLYIKSRRVYVYSKPNSKSYGTSHHTIVTDVIGASADAGTPPTYPLGMGYRTVTRITPYTPGNTIVMEDGSSGHSIYTSAHSVLTLEKAQNVNPNFSNTYAAEGHIYWIDAGGTWNARSGQGEAYSTTVARTGGGADTVLMDMVNSFAAGTYGYPIRLGTDGAELVLLELGAGTHEITSYGAVKENGSSVGISHYEQAIVRCDNHGKRVISTHGVDDDDSVWTGDTGLTSFKITSTIVLTELTKVYVRISNNTPHAPGVYSYIDMTPVVVSS